MTFLLDTNVVSEWVKVRPDPGVVSWFAETDEDHIFISVITIAELRYGIARMEKGSRQKRLDEWSRHDLPLRFEGRILPIDDTIANAWGDIMAHRAAQGRPMNAMDAFIAATVTVNDLTLVTRNVSDFKPSVKAIIAPWSQK